MNDSDSTQKRMSSKASIIAIVQACLVTVLWSSSWVIIKFGLEDIPPLIFAALRYTMASVILLLLIGFRPESRGAMKNRSRKWWLAMSLYGLVYITGTQGTQFLALKFLPAISFSLILNLTPIIVLILAMVWLKENLSVAEILFVLVSLMGVFLYFYPLNLVEVSIFGLFIGVISLIANSISAIIGRSINRAQDTPAIIVTGISMTIGSIVLLILGLTIEGFTTLSLTSWISITWLAVVNTALAFTLWNRAMRELRAIDTTLINSTMMPQIVILSIVFLGEFPELMDWIGLILLAIGITMVQIIQVKRKEAGSV